ncbi:MAG: hypothetical protein ACYC1I_10325 [Acidimicrobiales bacterium]
MAVRNFDLTEPQSSRLTGLESAPLRRQDLRRTKQRFMFIAIVSLTVPFAAALLVLGVVR